MFHHTHAYLATKLYDSEDALLRLGSILPDLAVTGVINWENGLHGAENDIKFTEFIEQKYPKYIDLAKGVHAHNVIDDFTHLNYKGKIGYAFQNNKQLALMVGDFYELDEEKSIGKAHNFIESGVDILLLKEMPEVQTKLRLAINQLDRAYIAKILAEYFRTSPEKMLKSLNEFLDLFTKYDFSILEEWIPFWSDLEKLMKLKNIGDGKRRQLINKSLEITKITYKSFVEYSISSGKTYV